MELNHDIPVIMCHVRKEFLYDGDPAYRGQYLNCQVYEVTSIRNRALGFTAFMENGGVFWRLPISAFTTKRDAPFQRHDILQLWDCFSYNIAVKQTEFMKTKTGKCRLQDNSMHDCTYRFTVDWMPDRTGVDTSYCEDPDTKCAHVVELANGNFAALPNNRILWSDSSYISKPFTEKPDWRIHTKKYVCEGNRYSTEDSDRFFYESKDLDEKG
jgi:hypothetical protein